MNANTFYFKLSMVAIIGLLTSCATPIAPTGGPADKKGPEVEYTSPKTGTTNFEGRSFQFQFDEYIRRSTVPNAITIEPDFGIDYELSWKKKKLTIKFKESLPDSTTIIIKLGTSISDTRSNKLSSPITLAISTGDEIDSGSIEGKVLLAKDGKAATDQKVFLYRQPVDFTKRARYEAQTDTSGSFEFSYLAEGNYKAVLMDDRNRNKIWDSATESAYPFFRETIELEKGDTDTLDVIYLSQVDSLAPVVQGVGLFSTNRMRIRFSESVKVNRDSTYSITDSAGVEYTQAYPLYVSPKENFVVFAQSDLPLLKDESYRVHVKGVQDMAGNESEVAVFDFTGSAQEDTTRQRIIGANDANGLMQNEAFKVTYAAPIQAPEIQDSLVVIEGNVDFNNWPTVDLIRNQLFIRPQKEWIEGVDYQFLVWNPDTQRRSMYKPELWDSTEYGEIEITIPSADSMEVYYLTLSDSRGNIRAVKEFNMGTLITKLPPLSYTLTLYRDDNKNKVWDRGTVRPYRSPEPYYVQQNLSIQEGFTSEVIISFD